MWFDFVHEGVVNDIQDSFLFSDLGKFIMTGRIGVLLQGDGEEELFLDIMDGQGVDTDVVEGVGVDGV